MNIWIAKTISESKQDRFLNTGEIRAGRRIFFYQQIHVIYRIFPKEKSKD